LKMLLFAPLSEVGAQPKTKPAIAPPSRTINLTAEQSFIIKEIVLKDLNVPKAQAGAPELTSSLRGSATGCMTYRQKTKKVRDVKTSNPRGDRTFAERGITAGESLVES
jgi:hypothetical protein